MGGGEGKYVQLVPTYPDSAESKSKHNKGWLDDRSTIIVGFDEHYLFLFLRFVVFLQ